MNSFSIHLFQIISFIMEQKKYFFKKFHKKYVFLQNSLFDFLYWRSLQSVHLKTKKTSNSLNKQSSSKKNVSMQNIFAKRRGEPNLTSSLLEQEKISFQEYWQTSDSQKIKNEIENMNKEFSMFNNAIQKQTDSKELRPSAFKQKQNSFSFFKKNFQKKENFHVFQQLEQGNEHRKVTKYSKKRFGNSLKYEKKTNQRNTQQFQIYLSSFAKNFQYCENPSSLSQRTETLIPKSDCFLATVRSAQQIEQFQFFNNIKLGEFFPKRKDFQQYWIFPLLGFILFFSSNSFRNFHIHSFQNNGQNTIWTEKHQSNNQDFWNFSFFKNMQKSQNPQTFNTLFNSSTNSKYTNFLFAESFFPESLYEKNSICEFLNQNKKFSSYLDQEDKVQKNSMGNFSYSNQKFVENAYSFEKMETNEFHILTKFYFQKLNNLFISFLIDGRQNQVLQDFLFEKNFDQNFFYKTMQSKRNMFNWQWFNLEKFEFQPVVPTFLHSVQFKIPQKAQFFETSSMNETFFSVPFSSKGKKTIFFKTQTKTRPYLKSSEKIQKNFQLTPLFQFSKSARFFNEFEKNLFFQKHLYLSEHPIENFSNKHAQVFSLFSQFQKFKNELTNKQIQKFFKSLEKEKNKSMDFLNTQHNFKSFSNIFSVSENSKHSKILQKWLQTQNLWNIQKIEKNPDKKTHFGSKQKRTNIDVSSFSNILSKEKDSVLLFPTITSEKLVSNNSMNNFHFNKQKEIFKGFHNSFHQLDFIYFQKLLKQLSFPLQKQISHVQNVETSNSNSQKKQILLNFPGSQKTKNSLKKKLFDFYVLQHCNVQYKKYFKNHSFFSQSPDMFLKNSFDLKRREQKKKNIENISKKFVQNSQQLKEDFAEFSTVIFHQLPLFLDFGNSFLFCRNFQNITNLGLPINCTQQETSSGYSKTEKKVSPQFLRNSLFQTFGFHFQNSPFFLNNFQFFGSHTPSSYFHLVNHSLNFLQYPQSNREISCFNFQYFQSKLNSFEKILKTSNKYFWFQLSSVQFFKTTFFFEKMKKPQALTFQIQKTSKNVPLSHHNFWLFSNFFENGNNKKEYFLKNSKYFTMQYAKFQKTLNMSSQSILLKKKDSRFLFSKYEKSSFHRSFHSRKFEKIFQMSLSPLNKEKRKKSSMFLSTKIQNKEASSFFENTKTLFLFKSKNDRILLQNFSKSLQNLYNSSKSSIQLFSNIENSLNKEIEPSFSNTQNFQVQTPKTGFRDQKFKDDLLFKKEAVHFSKSVQSITPNILLKRDGFLFFPFLKHNLSKQYSSFQIFDYSVFGEAFNKKQLQIQPQLEKQKQFFWKKKTASREKDFFVHTTKNQKNFSISNYSGLVKNQQNSFFQRFEKEKAFQKKRRLKKQKFETRRRKKRKRFFPRPLWLRFHLYKKFLNIRHPQKFEHIESKFLSNTFSPFFENSSFLQKNEHFKNDESFSSMQDFQKIKKNSMEMKNSVEEKNRFSGSCKTHLFFPKKTHINFQFFFMPPIEKNFSKYENIQKNSFLSLKYKKKKVFPFISQIHENIFQNCFQHREKSNIFIHKKTYESFKNRLYDKNNQKWGFYGQNSFQKKTIVKKFATNSFIGESVAQHNKIFSNRNEDSIISKNIEHYKISGEILREFIRLSWKSYWFQTNFQPYTQQLTKNFQKMKNIEADKSFAKYNIFQVLGKFQFPFLFTNVSKFQNEHSMSQSGENFSPLASEPAQFFQNISFQNSNSQNDFLFRKSLFKKFLAYSNIQTSLNSNFSQNNSSIFLPFQNIPEYNRILYCRVSELLKNGKVLENNDEFVGKNMTIFSQPKRKNEKMAASNTNFSFFTKAALFSENFGVPSQPEIPAFSLFSSLFQDSSIKPTGELPTLRSLWAFHQTNLYDFQETNAIRNVWTFKKRTESLKNLKGTKQVFNFLKKFRSFEKTNVFGKTNKNFLFSSVQSKQNMEVLDRFFVSRMKSESHEFGNQLEKMCWKKFQNAEKKSSLFGMKSLKQNSKLSLRYLKFHLLSKYQFESPDSLKKQNTYSPGEQNSILLSQYNLQKNTGNTLKKPNSLNSAKSSLNSWWAQKNFQIFPFVFSTGNSSKNFVDFELNSKNPFLWSVENFSHLSFLPGNPSSENQGNSFSPSIVLEHDQNSKNIQKGFRYGINFFKTQEKTVIGKYQLICFGALLFHLAIFSTVLKIPEIRSVLKFQCLIFYKLLNGFSVLLFSIYQFVKKYTEKIVQVFEVCFSFLEHGQKKRRNFAQISHTVLFSSSTSQLLHDAGRPNFNDFGVLKAEKERIFLDQKKNNALYGKTKNSFNLSILKKQKNFLFDFFIRVSNFSSLKTISKGKKFDFILSSQNFLQSQNTEQSKFLSAPLLKVQKKNKKFVFRAALYNQNRNKMNFQKQNEKFTKFVFSSVSQNLSKTVKNSLQKQYIFMYSENQKFHQRYETNHISKFPSFSSFFNLSNQFWKIQDSQKPNYSKNANFNFSCKQIFIFEKHSKILCFKKFFAVQSVLRKKENSQISSFSQILNDVQTDVPSNIFNTGFSRSVPLYAKKSKSHPFSMNMVPSMTEKFSSELALSFLIFGKSLTFLSLNGLKFGSSLSALILNAFEFVMFSIYKFLEKPAELMIEWIALIFLIEWSSDVITFLPETFDISIWKTSQKFLRPLRSGSLALNVFNSSMNSYISVFSSFSSLSFFHVANSMGVFTYSNILSFMVHKRFSFFVENFAYEFTKPDIDILVRQRKGMIFWDIWAEILLKAAEKYNVNIPSFVTLKDEQELFIEKLLQDAQFLKNVRSEKTISQVSSKNLFQIQKKKDSLPLNVEVIRQNSLMSFIENFLIKERPSHLSNSGNGFHLSQNIDQQIISNGLFSPSFNQWILHSAQNQNVQLFSDSAQKNVNTVFSFDFLKNKKFLEAFHTPFVSNSNTQFSSNSPNAYERWACNQNGISQSPETDLFVDIHPSKSLQHIHYLKYYEPAQYTLGSLICQVYSGLFSKQVSKNILLIGSPGTAKTLFIQALAGETEMKMITDNAYRYSAVQRGVAVGMKYLRDVFDAIALQTPCFFLMEHIHVIGSKRPLLISDDENVKGIQTSFGLDQQEVHETNQMIYQSSKHSISDYKRPYKGDFSMSIATNFFVQNFYSHIEKNSFSIFQNSQFSAGGTYTTSRTSPISPLPIDSIENSLFQQNFAQKENSDTKLQTSFSNSRQNRSFKFQSSLQIEKEQIFAPPATSPFTVLMMKEQKKLKPKKIVQENSWGGVSADQLVSYQKESYSIRAKVAILADITMNLSRGKLDMITDLLVIIDSVRSNRGFVVFATTHVPSSLDPALRRPGRFDETISLAQNTTFFNRFEILKMYFANSISTLDFVDSSMMTDNFSEIDLFNLITGTKLSFFRQYKVQNTFNSLFETRMFSYISPNKALQSFLKSSFFHNFYQKHHIFRNFPIFDVFKTQQDENFSTGKSENSICFSKNTLLDIETTKKTSQNSFSTLKEPSEIFIDSFKQNSFVDFRQPQLQKFTILPKGPSHILSNAYSKIGSLIIQLNFVKDPTCCAPVNLTSTNSFNNQTFLGISLYGSQKQQKIQLMCFLSAKVAEFFTSTGHSVFSIAEPILLCNSQHSLKTYSRGKSISQIAGFLKSTSNYYILNSFEKRKSGGKNSKTNFDSAFFKNAGDQNDNEFVFENSFELFDRKFSIFPALGYTQSSFFEMKNQYNKGQNEFNMPCETTSHNSICSTNTVEFQKIKILNCSVHQSYESGFLKNSYFWSAFGNDESWRSTTPFLYSMIQKRFLFTKNLLLSKMLFFENRNSRKQPPSPPSSSIFMPSKKYENFKRTENDFLTKARFSINEKIQFHQQQRFLKQLYNVSVQQYFRSEIVQKRQTFFGNAFQEIAYLDIGTSRSSSVQFYQRKYLGFRHRFSNINQWWTGLLPEHNTETTYLSDVDWRTMFISKNSHSSNNQTFELTMDFPDAEQYYNPKNRRWYFNSNSFNTTQNQKNSSYWLSFDTNLQYEIYYHFLMHSFQETYQYFEKNREMLDFFVFSLLKVGFLKEFDYLTLLSRFQKIGI